MNQKNDGGEDQKDRLDASDSEYEHLEAEKDVNTVKVPILNSSGAKPKKPSLKNKHSEVKDFLKSMDFEQYFDKFIENGIEDLETILELKSNHLDSMEISMGHRLKFMKYIVEKRTEVGLRNIKKSSKEA